MCVTVIILADTNADKLYQSALCLPADIGVQWGDIVRGTNSNFIDYGYFFVWRVKGQETFSQGFWLH